MLTRMATADRRQLITVIVFRTNGDSPLPQLILALHSSFLRRQESHSVVYTNNGGFGDNRAYFVNNSPFPRRIPVRIPRQIRPDSPSPTRPFLRRQESHSVVPQTMPNPPTIPRPQADHSCEGRNLIAIGRHRRLRDAAVGGTQL